MRRPLVPGAGVVARVVAGAAQDRGGHRGARAAVAVADDLGAFRQPDDRTQLVGRMRCAAGADELRELEMPRSRDMPLAWVARVPGLAGELDFAADIEKRQVRVVEALEQV